MQHDNHIFAERPKTDADLRAGGFGAAGLWWAGPSADEWAPKSEKNHFIVIFTLVIITKTTILDDIMDFIEQFEGQQKLVLRKLHNLIVSYPRITAKIRYKIPFYYQKSWICYLNPVKNGGIELAFPRGNELSNQSGILHAKGRKQVMGVEFGHPNEIDPAAIEEILQEALILDEQVKYASKRSLKRNQK